MQTEVLVHEIGKKWSLDVLENDKETLKYVAKGKDVFFMVMESDNNPIIAITNHGVPEILTIHVTDYGEMPIEKLESLTNDILTTIEAELGITFVNQNIGQES
jgi:hypothetical protein